MSERYELVRVGEPMPGKTLLHAARRIAAGSYACMRSEIETLQRQGKAADVFLQFYAPTAPRLAVVIGGLVQTQ